MIRHRHVLLKTALSLLMIILASSALTAQTKIRIKDAGAVIRMEPAANSEIVQDKLAVGTVFTAERKTGAWYEVKYRSAIGVLLTGFIHESAVEKVQAEAEAKPLPPPPVKKPVAPRERAAGTKSSTMEAALGGGLAFTSFSGGNGTYGDSWGPVTSLQKATETESLDFALKNPIGFGASFSYFFTPNIGVRLRLDYQTKQTIQDGLGDYGMTFNWFGYSNTTWTKAYPLEGDFSVMPISLNGVYKFPLGTTMNAFVTAGASYFMGKFKADSSFGYGWTWISGITQYIDYFSIPVMIDKSLNGIGFNAGAGLDIRLGTSFGIFVEADYFGGPSSTENWLVAAGGYPSNINAGNTLSVSQEMADELSTYVTPLDIKLSFFKIMVGVKIGL